MKNQDKEDSVQLMTLLRPILYTYMCADRQMYEWRMNCSRSFVRSKIPNVGPTICINNADRKKFYNYKNIKTNIFLKYLIKRFDKQENDNTKTATKKNSYFNLFENSSTNVHICLPYMCVCICVWYEYVRWMWVRLARTYLCVRVFTVIKTEREREREREREWQMCTCRGYKDFVVCIRFLWF